MPVLNTEKLKENIKKTIQQFTRYLCEVNAETKENGEVYRGIAETFQIKLGELVAKHYIMLKNCHDIRTAKESKKYTTLDDNAYDLTDLSDKELGIYIQMLEMFEQGVPSDEFSNTYRARISQITDNSSKEARRKVTKSPLYQICADLESRLMIQEGTARYKPK